jgi:F-type H+-transporting ATPase subunit a
MVDGAEASVSKASCPFECKQLCTQVSISYGGFLFRFGRRLETGNRLPDRLSDCTLYSNKTSYAGPNFSGSFRKRGRLMEISPDAIVYWRWGAFTMNATILFTWLIMAILTVGSWLVTRNLSTGTELSRWQNLLEVVVSEIRKQIADVSRQETGQYLFFVGTLFLFIALSNLLIFFPGYQPPTGSLSTTAALAICVFIAVPLFGIAQQGIRGYLKHYTRPTVFMLPFNIISEVSRTIALAVRLFGNIMSGTMIVAILLSITPFIFPIVMQVLGLLTGMIQAYIFAILSIVYIASASRSYQEKEEKLQQKEEKQDGRSEENRNKGNKKGGRQDG